MKFDQIETFADGLYVCRRKALTMIYIVRAKRQAKESDATLNASEYVGMQAGQGEPTESHLKPGKFNQHSLN